MIMWLPHLCNKKWALRWKKTKKNTARDCRRDFTTLQLDVFNKQDITKASRLVAEDIFNAVPFTWLLVSTRPTIVSFSDTAYQYWTSMRSLWALDCRSENWAFFYRVKLCTRLDHNIKLVFPLFFQFIFGIMATAVWILLL